MKKIFSFTRKEFIKILTKKNKYKVIEELAEVFNTPEICSDWDQLVLSLKEREEIMTTGIGLGIAIPHVRIPGVKKISFAIGISKQGIDFMSLDGNPVNLVVLVVAAENQHKEYLRLLSKIMLILKQPGVKDKIVNSDSPKKIFKILEEYSLKESKEE